MNSTVLGILVISVVAAIIAAVLFYLSRRHSVTLRKRFGSEYERAVRRAGDRWRAEAKLEEREKRVARLEIRSLSPEDRARFATPGKGFRSSSWTLPESAWPRRTVWFAT